MNEIIEIHKWCKHLLNTGVYRNTVMLYSASSLIFGTPFKSFPSFPSLACWAFILKITFNLDYSNTYTNQTYVILYGCYLSVICTDICLGSNQEILIVPQGGYLDGLTDLSSSRSITASKGHISYTHWSGNSWNLTSTSHPQTAFVPILALFFKSGGVSLVMRDMGNYFFFFPQGWGGLLSSKGEYTVLTFKNLVRRH